MPWREVPGTVEHPQSSLECMCHNGINPNPWLMLYIYDHPSQQKTWILSWTVWADAACAHKSRTCSTLKGLFPVCDRVVETGNGLRLNLGSLSFCCALSSLTAQRRDRVWCVFWRPAALSTLRPPVRSDTMEAEGLGVTERGGRVCEERWVTAPLLKREMERVTDEEGERKTGDRRGGVSQCGQCPGLEERAL